MGADFQLTADDLICKVLRRERPKWPFKITSADAFLHRARRHGVAPLVAALTKELDWPDNIRSLLHTALIVQAKWELRHCSLIRTVVEELSAISVKPILLKGTAFAYTLYPDPLMRRRGDTDILIEQNHRTTAGEILASLGFEQVKPIGTKLVSYQSSFAADHGLHWIDLHWKITDSDFVARKMEYRQLSNRLVSVPSLSPNAQTLDLVHSLLFACIHRAKHIGRSDDRLIWSYDMHLMLERMSTSTWESVVRAAGDKGMMGLLQAAVVDVTRRFRSSGPFTLRLAQHEANEAVTGYYQGNPKKRNSADFWAAGPLAKMSMLYPKRSYLEKRFGRRIHWALLPWFAIMRLLGRPKRLR